ncbi:MAG: type IV secretion system protein VirB3 [Steroidobacteraceae bacterium]
MSGRNAGLTADPLFVAVTRPPMRWGVTFSALLFNLVFTMEVFLLTRNLLTLLLVVPIHGICALLCLRDPRIFDLILLWGRTRLPAYAGTYWYWRASSYGALALDLPDRRSRRRASPVIPLCALSSGRSAAMARGR